MKKKILVLTGSPRIGGNSDLLAEAFIKGALSSGNEIERFNAGRSNIEGCRACDSCFKQGKACVFNDDFNELAPLLLNSDVLVFVTPIYWYSFPSSIKAAIDKIYSFIVAEKQSLIKESMLITCGEFTEERIFEGLKKTYELILEDREWKDRGQLIVPGVNNIGDVLKTNGLEQAEKMGKSFIN